MLCKKYGFNLEKDFKYCPNCSTNVNRRNITIISSIIIVIVLSVGIAYIKSNLPINDKYLKKSLEKKYNEKFENIHLFNTST